jgi:hypothetical protein
MTPQKSPFAKKGQNKEHFGLRIEDIAVSTGECIVTGEKLKKTK